MTFLKQHYCTTQTIGNWDNKSEFKLLVIMWWLYDTCLFAYCICKLYLILVLCSFALQSTNKIWAVKTSTEHVLGLLQTIVRNADVNNAPTFPFLLLLLGFLLVLVNNWSKLQEPHCSSFLPSGCWQECHSQNIDKTNWRAAEHPHQLRIHRSTLTPPPSSSFPSLAVSISFALSFAGRQSFHRTSPRHFPAASYFFHQWQCWDLGRNGWGWSAFPFCVCGSACQGNPLPGEPPRYPAALQPAPAPKTVPSVWTPRPSPKAFLLGSSLCESVLHATKTVSR